MREQINERIVALPWMGGKSRLWSFADLIDCQIIFLMQAFEQLRGVHDWLAQFPDIRAELSDFEKHKSARYAFFEWLENMNHIIDDQRISLALWHLQGSLEGKNPMTAELLMREIQAIKHDLVVVLSRHKFAYIPPSVADYFEQDYLFGGEVYDKFPDAREDIKAAGNCIAANLSDGSVFYLMRVAERGLKKIAKRLKLKSVIGKKTVDISETDWKTLLDELKRRLESVHAERKVTASRSRRLSRYAEAIDQANAMRLIWRNGVSHLHSYNQYETLNAFVRVKGFMESVAKGF